MRWLLGKDLLILARSRLLVAILIAYPVVVALLIGVALSRPPSKPQVAIVDETPPGQTIEVGSQRVQVSVYAKQLLGQVQSTRASTRAQAIAQVKSGKVLAAVVIPRDIVARLESGVDHGVLEVLYDGDALQQSLVRSQLNSALAQANLGFSEQIQRAASQAIGVLLRGGSLGVAGAPANLIALGHVAQTLEPIIARLPGGHERQTLTRIQTLASFAAQNLSLARNVLSTVGQPIQVKSRLVEGRRTPLSAFAVVVAVIVSLMFVCMLLAAGSVASEREERTLSRLVGGPISRATLICEKLALAAGCALPPALAMLAAIGAFVSLQWSRIGLWLLALAFAALAFAALGTAIGALAREVRASSLLAFGLALPLIFLALVPAGSVTRGLYDVIAAISFVFPFKPALQALDAAVNAASPSLAVSIAHLLGLTALFAVLSRVGLRQLE